MQESGCSYGETFWEEQLLKTTEVALGMSLEIPMAHERKVRTAFLRCDCVPSGVTALRCVALSCCVVSVTFAKRVG